ncbi:MAG: class IV adenylate cyclase [Candidatus Sungbacteria bacterium]|nr:class IV adenylate cyclase [Candidatus Sungbacteria bacterium]
MQIEYEATYPNIDKNDVRARLKKVAAALVRPEYVQRRVVFNLPNGLHIKGGWLRVRDEGTRITMSLKIVDGEGIESQREILLEVNNFDRAEELLTLLGAHKKAYQENKRELWMLNGVEVTIDEWPFLEPFVEIEGGSEDVVKKISGTLGFDYKQALFCSVTTLYSKKYNLPDSIINNDVPKIIFDMENPFLRRHAK